MLTKFRNVEDIVKKYSNAGYKVSYEEENSLILEKVVGKEGRKVEVHIQKSKLYPTVVIVFPTVELEENPLKTKQHTVMIRYRQTPQGLDQCCLSSEDKSWRYFYANK